jgi:hypothetical protein
MKTLTDNIEQKKQLVERLELLKNAKTEEAEAFFFEINIDNAFIKNQEYLKAIRDRSEMLLKLNQNKIYRSQLSSNTM